MGKLRKKLLKQAIDEFNSEHPKLLMRWNRRPVSKLTIEVRPEKGQLTNHNLQDQHGYHQIEVKMEKEQIDQQKYYVQDNVPLTNAFILKGPSATPTQDMTVDLLTPNENSEKY